MRLSISFASPEPGQNENGLLNKITQSKLSEFTISNTRTLEEVKFLETSCLKAFQEKLNTARIQCIKAAQSDSVTSMYTLGKIYLANDGNFDPKKSAGWFQLAADRGHLDSMYRIAESISYRIYASPNFLDLSDGDVQQMLLYYRWAADRGHYKSMKALAYFYNSAGARNRIYYPDATAWFLKSLKSPEGKLDSDLLVKYGLNKKLGHGFPADHGEAMKYFLKAAELKNGLAMVYIGSYYQHGNGPVEPNQALAKLWYSKAQLTGSPQAIALLRLMDLTGK